MERRAARPSSSGSAGGDRLSANNAALFPPRSNGARTPLRSDPAAGDVERLAAIPRIRQLPGYCSVVALFSP